MTFFFFSYLLTTAHVPYPSPTDDSNSCFVIRLSRRAANNVDFPAFDAGLAEALRAGKDTFSGREKHTSDDDSIEAEGIKPQKDDSIELFRLDAASLLDSCKRNAVSSTLLFHRILDAVYDILFGLSEASKKCKKTSPLSSRPNGILYKVRAALGVNETQKRDALHAHLILWGIILTPEFMQSVYGNVKIEAAIAVVVESFFKTSTSAKVAAQAILRHATAPDLRLPRTRMSHSNCPVPICVHPCSHSINESNAHSSTCPSSLFFKRVHAGLASVNAHLHSFTCKKGEGPTSLCCRLAYPRHPKAHTGTIEIEPATKHPFFHALMRPEQWAKAKEGPLPGVKAVDQRMLISEVKRTCVDVEHIKSWQDLKVLLDGDFTAIDNEELLYVQLEYVAKTNPPLFEIIVKLVGRFNTAVVETSEVALATCACNTACYFLGSSRQARCALFYLVKYLTKDRTSLSNMLTSICDAKVKMTNYPSIADDSGTPRRNGEQTFFGHFCFKSECLIVLSTLTALHMIQILGNQIARLQQLSQTQVLSVFNAHIAHSFTIHNYRWCLSCLDTSPRIRPKTRRGFSDMTLWAV